MAYLAEAAIVFNLAYLEIKAKDKLAELPKIILKSLTPATESSKVTTDIVCEIKDCDTCLTDAASSLSINEINYSLIKELSNELHSGRFREHKNVKKNFRQRKMLLIKQHWQRLKLLSKAWSYANRNIFVRGYISFFHALVRDNLDHVISKIAVLITVLILILLTMLDSHVAQKVTNAFISLFHECNTSFFYGYISGVSLVFTLLTFCMFVPLFFWNSWTPLLKEYECLSRMMVVAYKKETATNVVQARDELEKLFPT